MRVISVILRPKLKRTLISAIALATVSVLALAATGFVVRERTRDADLRLAGALLAEGDHEGARALLAPTRGAAAARGLAWCDVMARATAPAAVPPLLVDDDPFPQVVLLRRMIAEGRFASVVALADNASAAIRPKILSLEQVARLELGQAVAVDASSTTSNRLDAEIREVAELRAGGSRQILRDRRGRLLGGVDGSGRFMPSPGATELELGAWLSRIDEYWAFPGLRLSIDRELSSLARRALQGARGTIVILDVATGAVLAAESDRRTIERESPTAFVDQLLEPASIAKLITASAALRAGLEIDSEIRTHPCHGAFAVEDGNLWCPVIPGRLDGLDEALARSCNTTFARLGASVGRDGMIAEYQRFGFATASDPAQGGQRPAQGGRRPAQGGRLRFTIRTQRELAELAVGLNNSEISPLHGAQLAAVFANRGQHHPELWVNATDGALGLTPSRIAPPAATVVEEPAIAERVAIAMSAVARYGTASGLAPRGYPVAMKTGTAAEPGRGYHVNYIGYAPAAAPRYAFLVRITNRPTSLSVRRTAQVVTSRFLSALARYDGAADAPALGLDHTALVHTAAGM